MESKSCAEVGVSSMKDDGMQYVLKNEPQLGLLNNMLDVMCIKTFADGSMGGRSAAMLKNTATPREDSENISIQMKNSMNW